MVEIKAIPEGEGTRVSMEMQGDGMELVQSSMAIIKTLFGKLRETDEKLYEIFLGMFQDNALQIMGAREDEIEAFEQAMKSDALVS